jgi:hypothetical protein
MVERNIVLSRKVWLGDSYAEKCGRPVYYCEVRYDGTK